jgi:drug/metabolite transporter (DMT)-like permease
MNWFWIALIGPILYAVTNHTDKYLIDKYLKGSGVGSLVIFSSLFSILALPIILLIHPVVSQISLLQGFILACNGILVVVAVLFYFYALTKDEASYVVPFYQTIPIFAFILAYIILGESVSHAQLIGSGIIIIGALVLSFDFGNAIRFKKDVVFLMLGASLLYAINSVLFKLIAVQEGFWTSLFWSFVGKIILGVIFIVCVSGYRRQFFTMMRMNRSAVLGLVAMSESLFIVAEAAMYFASLLAPVGLVLLANAFQPFFVLLFGVAITIFLPHIGAETLDRKHFIQKCIGIGFLILGTYYIGVI